MPSFSIEAPGEANPLTESTLLHTLQAASSNDPNQIQTGTKQLQEWERSPGYYKHLQSVFCSHNLPVEVRYLAIIALKNGVDKYWRKTATNAVNKEDKAIIRSRLISSGIEETDHRLALQNALLMAKIVRLEYPQEWPEAIANVLDTIRAASSSTNALHLERILRILLYIIKELSTARIQRSRTNLQAATPEILGVLGSIYVDKVTQWRQALQSSSDGSHLVSLLSESLLSIKTLRRLLISGYEFPNRDTDVCKFWELTLSQVQDFMTLVLQQSAGVASDVARLVERHLLQLSKFHLEMAEKHPAAFVLLPSSLPLLGAYWNFIKTFSESYGASSGELSEDDGPSTSERISLNGLLLIRACIRMAFRPANTFKYRQADEKEERRYAESAIKQDLLTQSFVEDIMTVIMTKFLVLRQNDLADWTGDSEDWVARQENESEDMNLSIRACSERLVLDLSTFFKSSLTEPILSLFHSVANLQNENILFKDAVYAAIGMAAAIFKNDIDFDTVLTSILVPEVQKQIEGANMLRRRIAIFVGQWVVVKISQESRVVVYQLFDHLLQRDDKCNDLVVRITGGQQFKNVVDDFDFDPKGFEPFAESIITRLMALIEEVEQTSTKLLLLETVSALIERFEFRVEPFADRIVNMLPALWEQSGEEHMMKQSILTVFSRLLQALKQRSARFHGMLIPLIRNAVQSDSEMQVYLLEEALDLWHFLIAQTPAPISSDLLSLVDDLFPYFDRASESLRAALEIADSYLLLAPHEMLSDRYRKPLMTSLTSIIGPKSNTETIGMVCNCMEVMIRTAASIGGEAATKQTASELAEIGFLPKTLAGLRSAWVAHCTTGPLAKVPAVDGVVETDYLAVLARILLASPSVFIEAINHTPLAARIDDTDNLSSTDYEPVPAEGHIKWLLEEWFSHLDNIGDPSRRKLMTLALTRLFATGHPAMLANLQLLMSLWTGLVTELCEPDPSNQNPGAGDAKPDLSSDSLVYADPVGLRVVEPDAPEDPEMERRRMLQWHDEVHRVALPSAIREALGAAIGACGGEQAFSSEWLANVDKDVVSAFGQLGIMG